MAWNNARNASCKRGALLLCLCAAAVALSACQKEADQGLADQLAAAKDGEAKQKAQAEKLREQLKLERDELASARNARDAARQERDALARRLDEVGAGLAAAVSPGAAPSTRLDAESLAAERAKALDRVRQLVRELGDLRRENDSLQRAYQSLKASADTLREQLRAQATQPAARGVSPDTQPADMSPPLPN